MRNYSNIAVDTTLTAGINAAVGSCVVASATGWPAAPFAAVLDPGLVTEEVVEVTVKVGTTFTITRGFDGTAAAIHALGAVVRHAAIAGDFTDLQAADTTNAGAISTHTALTTAAHGGIVASTDPRLTDARTPTAHAATHASIGTDPITIAESQVTNLTTDLGLKAPLASPVFTGVPAAPTAAPGTNTTQLATTAFVLANGGSGTVTSVTASAPLASSGGATPDISFTGILASTLGGTGVNNAGTLTIGAATTISGGGALALGGFTLTVPATGTAALLATANVFTLGPNVFQTGALGNVGVTVRGAASQSAVLQQWQNSSPANVAQVSKDGYFLGGMLTGGSASAVVFGIDAGRGIFSSGGGTTNIAGGAIDIAGFGATGIVAGSALRIGFSASAAPAATAPDTALGRNAAAVVEINTGTAGQWASLKAGTRDTNVSAINDGITIGHQISSGTHAAGLGTALKLNISNSTTPDASALRLTSELVQPLGANYTTRGKWQQYDFNGAREVLRGEADGTNPMIGFLGAAATARVAITGSRAGNAALASLLTELASKGLITDSTSA